MKFAPLFFASLLIACGPGPSELSKDASKELVYFKDHRTGLCFAFWTASSDTRSVTISHVPCENVERLLVNPTLRIEAQTAP